MKRKFKLGLMILGLIILVVALLFIFQNKPKNIDEYPFGLSSKKVDSFCVNLLEELKICSEGPENSNYVDACSKSKTLDLTIDVGFSEEVIQKVLEYCSQQS